ncbi:hypothetical protein ALQ86_01361 [Pseudomonas amygdali pv. eriobotryae]|uniref:Uncharacterized protein n=1 Tax=Pseudomonas amygdali pv. eriobotryae TaxID=129137 RepID=A0A3M3AGP0_PSEA0|nr:hypothetical protein ALQ86_01361 [Pseudomonas amygdali pv. eriobotryae]
MAQDAIAKILAKNGPMLSSELAKILAPKSRGHYSCHY